MPDFSLTRSNFRDFLPSTLDNHYSVLLSNCSKSVNLSNFSFLCLSCSPHLPLQLSLTLAALAAKLHKIAYLARLKISNWLLSVVVFPWSVAFIWSRSQAERRSVAGDRPGWDWIIIIQTRWVDPRWMVGCHAAVLESKIRSATTYPLDHTSYPSA